MYYTAKVDTPEDFRSELSRQFLGMGMIVEKDIHNRGGQR